MSLGGFVAERIFWYRNDVYLGVRELPEPEEYAGAVFEAEHQFLDPRAAWDDISSACRILSQLPHPPRLRTEAQRVSRLLRYSRTWSAVKALALPLAQSFLSQDEANAILEEADPPTENVFRSLFRR